MPEGIRQRRIERAPADDYMLLIRVQRERARSVYTVRYANGRDALTDLRALSSAIEMRSRWPAREAARFTLPRAAVTVELDFIERVDRFRWVSGYSYPTQDAPDAR